MKRKAELTMFMIVSSIAIFWVSGVYIFCNNEKVIRMCSGKKEILDKNLELSFQRKFVNYSLKLLKNRNKPFVSNNHCTSFNIMAKITEYTMQEFGELIYILLVIAGVEVNPGPMSEYVIQILEHSFGDSIPVNKQKLKTELLGENFSYISSSIRTSLGRIPLVVERSGREFLVNSQDGSITTVSQSGQVRLDLSSLKECYDFVLSVAEEHVKRKIVEIVSMSEEEQSNTLTSISESSVEIGPSTPQRMPRPPVKDYFESTESEKLSFGWLSKKVKVERQPIIPSSPVKAKTETTSIQKVKSPWVYPDKDNIESQFKRSQVYVAGHSVVKCLANNLFRVGSESFVSNSSINQQRGGSFVFSKGLSESLKNSTGILSWSKVKDDSCNSTIFKFLKQFKQKSFYGNVEDKQEDEMGMFDVLLSESDLILLWVLSGHGGYNFPSPNKFCVIESKKVDSLIYNLLAPRGMSLELFNGLFEENKDQMSLEKPDLVAMIFLKSWAMGVAIGHDFVYKSVNASNFSVTESLESSNGSVLSNSILNLMFLDAKRGKVLFNSFLRCSSEKDVLDMKVIQRTEINDKSVLEVYELIKTMHTELELASTEMGLSKLSKSLSSFNDAIARIQRRRISTLGTFSGKSEVLEREIKNVSKNVRQIFPQSVLRKITSYCIARGMCPPATISGIISSLYTCVSQQTTSVSGMGDDLVSYLNIIRLECEYVLEFLHDIHHKLSSQADKIIKLLQYDQIASYIKYDLESGLLLKEMQQKAQVFMRVKGEINEMLMKSVLNIADSDSNQTFGQIIAKINFFNYLYEYCPTLVKEELNNTPDGFTCVEKSQMKSLFHNLKFYGKKEEFAVENLESYSRELLEPVHNVLSLDWNFDFGKIKSLADLNELNKNWEDISEKVIVIYEFGHTNSKSIIKRQQDIAKYTTLSLINKHLCDVVLVVLTTSSQNHNQINNVKAGLNRFIDSIKLCDSMLSICFIDSSYPEDPSKSDSKVQYSSSRMPLPEITEESVDDSLSTVVATNSKGEAVKIFPPKMISTLFSYMSGRTELGVVVESVDEEEIFSEVMKVFNESAIRYDLPQFSPMTMNDRKSSDILVNEFWSGVVDELSKWDVCESDIISLNSLYLKQIWRVDKSDPMYQHKASSKEYQEKIKLNDTLSSSLFIRLRSIINSTSGRRSHTDLISADEDLVKICDEYCTGEGQSISVLTTENMNIEVARSLISGIFHAKLNMISTETPMNQKVQRLGKVAQQDFKSQKIKDTCLYQIVCHFTASDSKFIRLGRSSVIKKFSGRDPELIRTTFKLIGVKEPSKAEISSLAEESSKSLRSRSNIDQNSKVFQIAVKLESVGRFYYQKAKELIGKVNGSALNDILSLITEENQAMPITLSRKGCIILDDKTSTEFDWKLSCLVLYVILYDLNLSNELNGLFCDKTFEQAFGTQLTPYEIAESRLKSLAKRQLHNRTPVIIQSYDRLQLLYIPLANDVVFTDITKEFWMTLEKQRGFLSPEYLNVESKTMLKLLHSLCNSSGIIDDIIIMSRICSEILSLTGAKSRGRSSYHSVKITETLNLIVNVPKADSTLYRVAISTSTDRDPIISRVINVDELDLLPMVNAPYYFLYYMESLITTNFKDLISTYSNDPSFLNGLEMNTYVSQGMRDVHHFVSDCVIPFEDIHLAADKVRVFLNDMLSASAVDRLFFHLCFLKMVSIPALICNDKSHNTTMQNIRYIYMSTLSEQFDIKGMAKKLVNFSRKIECQLHMVCIVTICAAVIKANSMGETIVQKKLKFEKSLFIDPMTAGFCNDENAFVNSFYEMHGYVRGLLSEQSNANVHNAFFEIPLTLSAKMANVLTKISSCELQCVNLNEEVPWIEREVLCQSCRINMDKYVRSLQIPMYNFSSKKGLLTFIKTSLSIVLSEPIKETHGCPYMQMMVGKVAFEDLTIHDKSESTQSFDLKSLSRTELLQSTSIISGFDLKFNPIHAQSKSADILFKKIFGNSDKDSVSTFTDELIDKVKRSLEETGIDVEEILQRVKQSVHPSLYFEKGKIGKTGSSESRKVFESEQFSKLNSQSISSYLLQPELTSSVLKVLGQWVVWSKDSVLESLDVTHQLEFSKDPLTTLMSMQCKIAVTGIDPTSSEDSSFEGKMKDYDKLVKTDLGQTLGITGKKLRQIKYRITKKHNSNAYSEYNKSEFKSRMSAIGNQLITSTGQSSQEYNEMDIDGKVNVIENVLENLMAESSRLGDAIASFIRRDDFLKLAASAKKSIIIPESLQKVGVKHEAELKLAKIAGVQCSSEFSSLCARIVDLVDTVQQMSMLESDGMQREMMRAKLSLMNDLGKEMKELYDDEIVKIILLSINELSLFPLSLMFPQESKYLSSGEIYHRFCKTFHPITSSVECIASGMLVCFGSNLGDVIQKTLKLTFEDVERDSTLLMLTTPVMINGELFNPCLPLLDSSLGLSRKVIEALRYIKNGTSIPKVYCPFRLKSNRVSFEIASDITRSSTSLLWDSVAYHMGKGIKFIQKIAAKAQFGSERDLVVQDLGTKECMALLERISKKYLLRSKNDILVHPEKKIGTIKDIAKSIDERLTSNSGNMAVFSSDETKWGPTHNAFGFLNTLLPLFEGNQDYKNLLKFCCTKNVGKYVMVQPRLVQTVISFLTTKAVKIMPVKGSKDYYLVDKNGVELSKQEYTTLVSELSPGAVNVLEECILKGKTFLRSPTHMGQGIFHATSSLAADCYVRFETRLRDWISENNVQIKGERIPTDLSYTTHRSSDDSITVVKSQSSAPGKFQRLVSSVYYLDTALQHTMNIRKSVKHVGASVAIIGEVYSTFTTDKTVSPTIKVLMALITAPPSSTLLGTSLTRYNLVRNCIESGSHLIDAVFTCVLAYARDAAIYPKTSPTFHCGREYPMCYSSRPDIKFSSLFADPFTSELCKLLKSLRFVIGNYFAALIENEPDIPNEILEKIQEGDYDPSVQSYIDSVDIELENDDIKMSDVLFCALEPGEVYEGMIKGRRAVRARDSGIYSDIQLVPQSRMITEKFREVKSAITGDLTITTSPTFSLLELAASQKQPRSFDVALSKAGQSVRNQDPNSQRSLNPVNAFNQSQHGIRGYYCRSAPYINCPRARLTSGAYLTTLSKFSKWSVNYKELFKGKTISKLIDKLGFFSSLVKLQNDFNPSLSRIERVAAAMKQKDKSEFYMTWKVLVRPIRIAPLPVPLNEVCCYIIDPVLMDKHGLMPDRQMFIQSVELMAQMDYNLLALPICIRVLYLKHFPTTLLALPKLDKITEDEFSIAIEEFKHDTFPNFDREMMSNSIKRIVNTVKSNWQQEESSELEYCFSIIKHWSDLLIASNKRLNPIYMECGSSSQRPEEEDLIKFNSSNVYEYNIGSDYRMNTPDLSRANLKIRETSIRNLISVASVMDSAKTEEMAQKILNKAKQFIQSEPKLDIISNDILSLTSHGKSRDQGRHTKSVNVTTIMNKGIKTFLYRDSTTKKGVLLTFSTGKVKKSFIVSEDHTGLQKGLNDIHMHMLASKERIYFRDIISWLPQYSFSRGFISDKKPIQVLDKGEVFVIPGSISKPTTCGYATIAQIGISKEENPIYYKTRDDDFRFGWNSLFCETVNKISGFNDPILPFSTLAGQVQKTEVLKSSKKVNGSWNFTRGAIRVAVKEIGSHSLKSLTPSVFNFLREKEEVLDDPGKITAFISSNLENIVDLVTEGNKIKANLGGRILPAQSCLFPVVKCINSITKGLIHFSDLRYEIMLSKMDRSKILAKIFSLYGSDRKLLNDIVSMRNKVSNLAKGVEDYSSVPSTFTVLDGKSQLFIYEKDAVQIVQRFKDDELAGSLRESIGKALKKYEKKQKIESIARVLKKIIKSNLVYSPFAVDIMDSKQNKDIKGLLISSAQWKSDYPMCLFLGIHNMIRDQRIENFGMLLSFCNTLYETGTGESPLKEVSEEEIEPISESVLEQFDFSQMVIRETEVDSKSSSEGSSLDLELQSTGQESLNIGDDDNDFIFDDDDFQ